jgi:hypothetical protein
MTAATMTRQCGECGRTECGLLRRGLCHACYERSRRRGTVPSLVDPTPAIEHIGQLRAMGLGTRSIAARAGVDRSVITKLAKANPDRHVNADSVAAILSVPVPPERVCPEWDGPNRDRRLGVAPEPRDRRRIRRSYGEYDMDRVDELAVDFVRQGTRMALNPDERVYATRLMLGRVQAQEIARRCCTYEREILRIAVALGAKPCPLCRGLSWVADGTVGRHFNFQHGPLKELCAMSGQAFDDDRAAYQRRSFAAMAS